MKNEQLLKPAVLILKRLHFCGERIVTRHNFCHNRNIFRHKHYCRYLVIAIMWKYLLSFALLIGLFMATIRFAFVFYPSNPSTIVINDHPYVLQPHLRHLTTDKKVQGAHHHNIYRHNFSHSSNNHTTSHPSWHVLKEVDGLKNEDVVMLVTSTNVKDFIYIRERVIPSARTWMRLLANVFVIVEDTAEARFALRFCLIRETAHFTSFDCPHEPTYVLSRQCNSEYYGGAGPCCKVDDLFQYLTVDRADLFAHTKFALHCDDDMYWRVDQVLRWLAAVDHSGVSAMPIVASTNFEDEKEHVWHVSGCEEIHTNGWYQPMMLNHAALERMKHASSRHGLQETCVNFDVTHDVGMGVYAWLFGLYHMKMPHVGGMHGEGKSQLPPADMAVHAIKHKEKDSCAQAAAEKWPESAKYNQKMVIGCGDMDHPSPGHDPDGKSMVADMYDAWDFYRVYGEDVAIQQEQDPFAADHTLLWETWRVALLPYNALPVGAVPVGDEQKSLVAKYLTESDEVDGEGNFEGYRVVSRFVPSLNRLSGYETTLHSTLHNITAEGGWKEFKLSDCAVMGSVQK